MSYHIISYLLIALALSLPLCNGVLEEISPPDISGTGMVKALKGDASDPVASNVLDLNKLSSLYAKSLAEPVFVIGESAILNTTSDLENLFKDVQGQKLSYNSDLTKLYGEMGATFGRIRSPINHFQFEQQMPPLPGDSIPVLTNRVDEAGQYFSELEPPSTSYLAVDMPWSYIESNQGVTVIWNQ